MKFKYKEAVFAFALVFVMLFNAIGMAVNTFSNSMDDLPEGRLLCEQFCPSDAKILKLYLVELEGVNTALRGEVSYFNKEGKLQTRNVYWHIGETQALIGWKDEDTVIINDKEINIYGEPYDSRTQIELPEHSAKNRIINEE